MANEHHIRVATSTWQSLNARKAPGDDFNDVVTRLLDRDPDTQAVRNALDDLKTVADNLPAVDRDDADVIRETVKILRDELEVQVDE